MKGLLVLSLVMGALTVAAAVFLATVLKVAFAAIDFILGMF
ncbi:hypothetical protein y223_00035 [Bordetella phage PY223]